MAATYPAWFKTNLVKPLVQESNVGYPELDKMSVPLTREFARTPEQKQILRLIFARQVMGRPYFAPPGVPADRAEVLRKAFMETMEDKDFRADAEKAQLEITPVPGSEVQKLVTEVYATPPEIAKKAAAILGAQ